MKKLLLFVAFVIMIAGTSFLGLIHASSGQKQDSYNTNDIRFSLEPRPLRAAQYTTLPQECFDPLLIDYSYALSESEYWSRCELEVRDISISERIYPFNIIKLKENNKIIEIQVTTSDLLLTGKNVSVLEFVNYLRTILGDSRLS